MGKLNKSELVEVSFTDFSGGYAGIKGTGTLKANEAKDLDNIVVLPSGAGFRARNGNLEHIVRPAATSMTLPTTVLGLLLFEYEGDTWILKASRSGGLVSNEVYLESANVSASSTAVTSEYATASYTFTANHQIQFHRVNNLLIGLPYTTGTVFWPPVQLAMSASGGAAAASLFSGAVAEGRVGMFWNNRLWIGNLTGEQSKLKYSILAASGVSFAASTSWTNSGSGFVEPARGDGDELMALAPISNNVMLYFKKNSIHQVVGRSDPFSVFPLFQNVGAGGRGCVVEAEGLVYFITPDKRMLITDGSTILTEKDLPALGNAKDLWNGVSTSRLYLTQGFRHKGRDFDWIVWMTSSSGATTNDIAIIWDRINQCWLRCSSGFNGNAVSGTPTQGTYIGGYSNARIYKLDATTTYADYSYSTPLFGASNVQIAGTNPQVLTWYWRSDDMFFNSLSQIVNAKEVNVSVITTTTADLDFAYSFNGAALSSTITKSIVPTSYNYVTTIYRPLGRGKSFGVKIFGNDAAGYQVNSYSMKGQQQGRIDTNKGLV